MKTRRSLDLSLRTLPLLAAGFAALVSTSQAQTLQVKPGLWASSTVTTLNGKRLPTVLDSQGALSPQQRSSIVAAMERAGLPAGGSPALYCQKGSTYTLPTGTGVEGCRLTPRATDANRGTVAVSCASGGTTLKGQGSYEITGGSAATVQWEQEGTHEGAPIRMKQQQVSKWISGDCSKPPQGIDPSLFQLQH